MVENLDSLKAQLGKEIGISGWLEMTQERINQFAETTEDRQWIHTDRERAGRESPYGTTIAHGFLTLSLFSRFLGELAQVRGGVRMSVNYGLNRVRFTAAVPAGSRIRARFGLAALKESADFVDATYAVTVERKNEEKPCCIAEWIVRYYR